MIKANELRIGNYIKFHNHLEKEKIVSINARFFSSLAGGRSLEDIKPDEVLSNYYQPIPITPEILEKCGFDVVHKTNNHYAINDPNGIKDSHKISVFPTVNNQWHIAFSDTLNGYNDYTPTTKIQYLHQLQNLYFALTGEELTFKP